jgi:hypothetical protein
MRQEKVLKQVERGRAVQGERQNTGGKETERKL